MPVTWVACRMVPSTPARMLYRCFQCWVDWPARAAATASWISRGRRNSWRPVRDVVHWALAGQARQVAVANLTTIACLFCCWTTWLQPVLVAPWGQITCWWSQSMVNVSEVYPPERACGGLADSSGPSRVMPRARASSSRSAEVYPASTACSPGASPAAFSMSWMGSVIAASGTVASVAATLVIRFGASRVPSGSGSQQVSLMRAL